ncbi:hypothetical protein MUDAN_IGPPGNFN_03616 [Lactiplantibacillus mudanjiangensis]|nr:hypothetical protein MUDAN_IGPPGNFN_03616 [Lactiplantibacillus mudanjiangensis]
MYFFFQAEDGIRDSSTSRGLGDVYKRQPMYDANAAQAITYVADNRIPAIITGAAIGNSTLTIDLSLIHI